METTWSKREKEIARRAYDAAYQRECAAIDGEGTRDGGESR